MKNYSKIWKEKHKLKQISYDEFVTKFPNPKAYYSEKIDGEIGALVISRNHEPFLQSSTAKEKTNLPVIDECKNVLENIGVNDCILICEVVAVQNNRILPFNKSQSIIKRFYVPSNKEMIHVYLIDVFDIDGKNLKYSEAIKFLYKYFNRRKLKYTHLPETVYGGLDQLRNILSSVKDVPGKEGIVVRDLDGKDFKIKFSDTVDVAIIGAGKVGMPSWEKDQISYLITAFVDKDGNYRRSSNVGTGFTNSMRRRLFNYFQENKLYVKDGEIFIHPNDSFVIEIRYDRYRLFKTQMYKFFEIDERYKYIQDQNGITFSFPRFERFRPDKDPVDKYDTRPEQIVNFTY